MLQLVIPAEGGVEVRKRLNLGLRTFVHSEDRRENVPVRNCTKSGSEGFVFRLSMCVRNVVYSGEILVADLSRKRRHREGRLLSLSSPTMPRSTSVRR
jgi:hypothetical protein